jgi:hypothetical protein
MMIQDERERERMSSWDYWCPGFRIEVEIRVLVGEEKAFIPLTFLHVNFDILQVEPEQQKT